MRRLLTFILFAVLVYCCIGCGSSYHLRRAKYHELKAVEKGAVISTDTTYKKIEFKTPGIKVQYEPRLISKGEVVILKKDSVITKVILKEGINNIDTVLVEAECPERKTEVEIPISVDKKIAPKDAWLLALGVGFLIGIAATLIMLVVLSRWQRR